MISIITVCYNEEYTIFDTIKSVYDQKYTDYEYIIKDAGSTDDTLRRARMWEKEFRSKGIPFKIITGTDRGIYDGMNQGVEAASGEYVNFMNAGDRFFSDEVLLKIFGNGEKASADLLYGDTAEEEYGELHYFRKCPELIESRMPFSHQSVFVKRELLLKYPFKLKYRIAADYDFLLTLHEKGYEFKDTGVLVARVSKTGSSSINLKDTYLETMRLRQAHGLQVPEGAELKKTLFWLNIKQFGMDYFPDALKYLIRKIQRYMRGQKKV